MMNRIQQELKMSTMVRSIFFCSYHRGEIIKALDRKTIPFVIQDRTMDMANDIEKENLLCTFFMNQSLKLQQAFMALRNRLEQGENRQKQLFSALS